jgi:hypothetical protein
MTALYECVRNVTLTETRVDWEEYIIQVAKEITEEQSPKRLLLVRSRLYELLSHCIPPEIILKVIHTPWLMCLRSFRILLLSS